MFRCPSCGLEDLGIWKACHWRRYSVYCHASELELFDKPLLDELKGKSWIQKDGYWFHLTRNQLIVYRMLQMGKDEFRTHGFTEKRKPAPNSK